MAMKKVLPQREKTIGELIDAYKEIANARAELSIREKALSTDQTRIKGQIFEAFESQKTTAGRGLLASASVTFLDVPKVVDETKAEAYLKRTGNSHIFTRKFAVINESWRELKQKKGCDIPGIETVIVKNLSVTKV